MHSFAVAVFFEDIVSGIYHICPSIINFQFDSTFMYILLAMPLVKLYKNKHPDSEVKPSVVLFVLSIIVLLTWVSLSQPDSSNYTGRAILTIGLAGITLIIIYMVYNLFITDLVYYYYKDFRKHKSIIRALRQMFFPKHNKSRIFQSITILINLLFGFYIAVDTKFYYFHTNCDSVLYRHTFLRKSLLLLASKVPQKRVLTQTSRFLPGILFVTTQPGICNFSILLLEEHCYSLGRKSSCCKDFQS